MRRRELLRIAAGTGALAVFGGAASGCGAGPEVSEAERQALAERTRRERESSGRGPLGSLGFDGYRGLAELPWLELDAAGRLVLARDDVPAGIDLHTHLGMALGFAPAPDLHARTERVRYVLDCDGEPETCASPLDLDVYMNLNFTEEGLSRLRAGALRQLTVGNPKAATHTIPNLAAELDRTGFEKAAVLPIAFGLPLQGLLGRERLGDDLAERWLAALAESPHAERFLPGASVHPRESDRLPRLRAQVRGGARILKLHPEMQRFVPDAPEAMEIYAECQRIGLPVIFHAGRSGIEPDRLRPYALLRHFEEPAAAFPDLPFVLGHGGARDWPDAIPLARRHPNLHLGIASLGASAIREHLRRVGPERVVFGSDWPFYPVATSLAKLLLAVEGRLDDAEAVLRGNALRIFASVRERRRAFLAGEDRARHGAAARARRPGVPSFRAHGGAGLPGA